MKKYLFFIGIVLSQTSLAAPIHDAIRDLDLKRISAILAADPEAYEQTDEKGQNLLRYALSLSTPHYPENAKDAETHVLIVKYLYYLKPKFKSQINMIGPNGTTPLHHAFLNEYYASPNSNKLAKFLLSIGADPELKDDFGLTPIAIAERSHNPINSTLIREYLQNRNLAIRKNVRGRSHSISDYNVVQVVQRVNSEVIQGSSNSHCGKKIATGRIVLGKRGRTENQDEEHAQVHQKQKQKQGEATAITDEDRLWDDFLKFFQEGENKGP